MEIYENIKTIGRTALIVGGLAGMLYASQPAKPSKVYRTTSQPTSDASTQSYSQHALKFMEDFIAKSIHDYPLIKDFDGKDPPELKGERWFNAKSLSLGKLKGKVVVLNFWSPSLPLSDKQMTYSQELWKGYKDKGLVVIGVQCSGAGNPDSVIEKYLRQHKITFPSVEDDDQNVARAYKVNTLPQTWLIDKKGKVRTNVSLKQLLEEKVEKR